MNILLLTHDFGFPEGTLRPSARLIAGAGRGRSFVEVYCLGTARSLRQSSTTRRAGLPWRPVPLHQRSTTGPSFAGRRTADARSLATAMRSIVRMRRAGRLDACISGRRPCAGSDESDAIVLSRRRPDPVALELNERPWNQGPSAGHRKAAQPAARCEGTIVISDYLEDWRVQRRSGWPPDRRYTVRSCRHRRGRASGNPASAREALRPLRLPPGAPDCSVGGDAMGTVWRRHRL